MLIVRTLYDCNTLYYSKVVVITHIHYKIQIQCLNKQYKIGIYSILIYTYPRFSRESRISFSIASTIRIDNLALS